MMKRYLPHWPLPEYAFLPGKSIHPNKQGGHMYGKEEPFGEKIDLSLPEKSEFLRYSLDLFNHGYYWESHVYLEALWNRHERTGPVANFLKALILISAGEIKISLDQKEAGVGHFDRALELIDEIVSEGDKSLIGFDLVELGKQLIGHRNKPGEKLFIYPFWN